MADIKAALKREALEIAAQLKGLIPGLQKERTELMARVAEINRRLQSAVGVTGRAQTYTPLDLQDYRCPSCWVDRGEKAKLRPVSNPHDRETFECVKCGLRFGP